MNNKDNLLNKITQFVDYEDGRYADLMKGFIRKDMGREARISQLVDEIFEIFKPKSEPNLQEFINELLDCFDIGSKLNIGYELDVNSTKLVNLINKWKK